MNGGQITIAYDYDERTARLATEIGIMLTPYLLPGTPRETVQNLATRIALVSEKRFKDVWEPACEIRCHTCDDMTVPKTRTRVAVCLRCATQGSTPGSSG